MTPSSRTQLSDATLGERCRPDETYDLQRSIEILIAALGRFVQTSMDTAYRWGNPLLSTPGYLFSTSLPQKPEDISTERREGKRLLKLMGSDMAEDDGVTTLMSPSWTSAGLEEEETEESDATSDLNSPTASTSHLNASPASPTTSASASRGPAAGPMTASTTKASSMGVGTGGVTSGTSRAGSIGGATSGGKVAQVVKSHSGQLSASRGRSVALMLSRQGLDEGEAGDGAAQHPAAKTAAKSKDKKSGKLGKTKKVKAVKEKKNSAKSSSKKKAVSKKEKKNADSPAKDSSPSRKKSSVNKTATGSKSTKEKLKSPGKASATKSKPKGSTKKSTDSTKSSAKKSKLKGKGTKKKDKIKSTKKSTKAKGKKINKKKKA